MTPDAFKDSQEAAFRRIIRDAIRRGAFTKSERDVTLSMVNIWFHHKDGPKGYIHPSREMIAKRAKVTVKTVSRTLSLLRDLGILLVVSNLNGGKATSTRYKVDIWELAAYCGCGWLDQFLAGRDDQNVPVTQPKMSRYARDKMSHCLKDVESNVFPMKRRAVQ